MEEWLQVWQNSLRKPDQAAREAAQRQWDSIAKPLGSLGALEKLVMDIAALTGDPAVDISQRAVVVCCADSRVPPEHIFHAGIGDLFVIRNAGNVMTPSALGSVEYAVGHLHVPLVLVMGHRGCGAVAAALLHGHEPGALGDLVAQVSAAVGHCHDPRQAERANLLHSLAALGASEHLTLLAEAGKVNFAAAIYDIRTGTVELCQDPQSP